MVPVDEPDLCEIQDRAQLDVQRLATEPKADVRRYDTLRSRASAANAVISREVRHAT